MMKCMSAIAVLSLLLGAQPVFAALNVFACEPEWGALAKALAGDEARVYVATNALQDPHHIEARPSLIARARRADMVVCTGAALEVGWLPLVQRQSGNPRIQTGEPGYFEAASQVAKLEVPRLIDRAQGDIHPAGNPHIHLNPHNIATIAAALAKRMAAIDPGAAADYAAHARAFLARWDKAIGRWEKMAAPLKGMPIVVYHRDFSYLIDWLGMREVGTLEPKPGLPPTTAHLSELLARLSATRPKAVVRAAYNPPQAAQWFSEHANVPIVVLPFTVGGTEEAKDLVSLYDDTLARLLAVAQ